MKFVKQVQLILHVGETGNPVKVSQCSKVIIFSEMDGSLLRVCC